MRILTTDHVPERLRDGIRSRAGDVGAATRGAARSAGDVAKSAGDRVRSTAADQLVKVGKVVEPDRSSGRSRLLYLLVVPVIVAGAVWVARAVRTRAAAGDDTGSGSDAEKADSSRSTASKSSPNGRTGPERETAGRGASKAS